MYYSVRNFCFEGHLFGRVIRPRDDRSRSRAERKIEPRKMPRRKLFEREDLSRPNAPQVQINSCIAYLWYATLKIFLCDN